MTTRHRLHVVLGAALAALGLLAAPRALAQCSVTAQPTSFEPNPPGLTRPLALLSPGFNSNLALYQNGAGGPWRILMQESFGYSTLDITNRTQPSVLKYDYLPFAPLNPVTRNGDGQSYISTVAASPDGQRASLATNGPADPPWHTIVGIPDGSNGFNIVGDAAPVRASATVIQQVGARYIHYGVDPSTGVYASDITSLGATLTSLNVPGEHTNWQPGVSPMLAGNYLVYPTSTGGIQVVDVGNPGPAGSITAAMPQTNITASALGQSARSISYVKAATDPSNSSKLWLLVEFYPAAGTFAPSYGLYYVIESSGAFGSPQPAAANGALFDVPALTGETWSVTGASSALISTNGTVQVLMWASRRLPSSKITLYASTAGSWGTWNSNNPQATDMPTGFGVNGAMGILPDTGTTVYAYIASIANAWVLPLSCQAADAPATSSFIVKNASNGNAVVNDGDTLPYGEQLTVTPTILPTPTFGQSSDLISWGWHIDLDFHQGAVVEDLGAGVIPRLNNSDANVFGSPTYPPASFTLVGPCDPKNSGTPSTGSGCWNSVLTNTAQGGPDFTGTETPATPKPTYLALEAINVKGSSSAKLFKINWKVPTLSLQTTQILAGDTLTAVTDGHPQGTFKWYFGPAPTGMVQASCTGATCTPAGADATQGIHHYWFQAPFAQIGYATPDYTTSSMGTYTVTNFAPAFTVNGLSTGTVTIGPAQQLTIANQSRRGTGTTGTYTYCLVSGTGACGSWLPYNMTDTSGPQTIANPGVGTYTLRLRVDYTGPGGSGTTYWPDPSGATGMTVVATNSLTVTAFASPSTVASGQSVTFNVQVNGGSGSYSYIWSGQFGSIGFTASFSQPFTNSSQQNATYLFTCDVTDTLTGATGSSNVTVTVLPGTPATSPTATAAATPNPAQIGSIVTFSCSATGGAGGYTYQWTDSAGHLISQNQIFTFNATTLGTVPVTCTATDSSNRSGTSTVNLLVTPPPGPACTAVDWDVYKGATLLVPTAGGLGLELPRTAAVGDDLTFTIKSGVSAQFDWDWGDGQPHTTGPLSSSAVTNPHHTYLSPATYTVTLRGMYVDNSGFCGGTSYQILITGVQVDPNFTPGYADATTFVTTNVMGGKSVRFQASEANADSYTWDFGDGFTGSGKVVLHSFAVGTPTVKLTVQKGATIVSSTLVLTVVAPPDPPRWALPGMAYVTGAGGTFWTSDVSIFNPDTTYSQNLKVAFLDGAHAVTDESQLSYFALDPIKPLAGINVPNALAALGRPVGSYGALVIKGEAGQRAIAPVFTTRTFNDQTSQGAGTFGLSVPSAASAGGGVTAQAASAASLLVGLRQNAAARTNLFLVNLNNEWPTVRLDFTDAAGKAIGSKVVTMNPFQSIQINNAVQEFAQTSDLYAVKVSIVDQSGGAKSYAVYPYATVIDQGSTDPIVVSPTSAPANAYRIPGIVRLTGANGEKFRSRVTITNPSAVARRVRLTYSFVSCDASGCSDRRSYTATVNMAAGQTQSWDDWVKVWFQLKYFAVLDETATYKDALLDVAADDGVADPLVVLGETYNDAPLGHIGLQVPGYVATEGASRTGASTKANTRLVLPGLRFEGNAAAGTGFRTNVAVFVTTGTLGGWCSAHVYGPDGTKISDTAIPVTPTYQISSAALGVPADFGPFSVVLDNFDDGITVAAYATIVDNKSGDSTFVKATPVP